MELNNVDGAGRVVLPKNLRDRLGLRLDSSLEVVEQTDGVFLRPLASAPSIVKIDGLWVHQGQPDTGARWDHIADDLRDERFDSLTEI